MFYNLEYLKPYHKTNSQKEGLPNYYTLDKIEYDLNLVAQNNPDLTELITIGNSFESHPIYAIKLGKSSVTPKPSILLIANIHAREYYTSLLAMNQITLTLYHYYLSGHWGPYKLKEILSEIDLWYIPVANPDGLNIVHHGLTYSNNYDKLIKMNNPHNDYRWWKSNSNGVDLNRNFDDGFWRIRQSPEEKASEMYKGDEPNSEPETKAIQSFCLKYKPVMSISYHSYGDIIYWADTYTHSYFNNVDTKVTESISKLSGYKKMPLGKDPKTFSCGFENWYRTVHKKISLCVELSPISTSLYKNSPYKIYPTLVFDHSKYISLQLAVEALKLLNN